MSSFRQFRAQVCHRRRSIPVWPPCGLCLSVLLGKPRPSGRDLESGCTVQSCLYRDDNPSSCNGTPGLCRTQGPAARFGCEASRARMGPATGSGKTDGATNQLESSIGQRMSGQLAKTLEPGEGVWLGGASMLGMAGAMRCLPTLSS